MGPSLITIQPSETSTHLTWLIRTIVAVTVVIVDLLEEDHLRAIDAQERLPLPVEAFICRERHTACVINYTHGRRAAILPTRRGSSLMQLNGIPQQAFINK